MSEPTVVSTEPVDTEVNSPAPAEDRIPDVLPDDHPLVRTLAAQKDTIKELRTKVSEQESTGQRLAEAEAEVASVPSKVADALRSHLIELHGIEAEDAELFLTSSDPVLLLKQVSRFVAQSDKLQAQGNVVPREGNNPQVAADPRREFLRTLMGRQ